MTYSTSEPVEAGWYVTSHGLTFFAHNGIWYYDYECERELKDSPPVTWAFGPLGGDEQYWLGMALKIAFAEMRLADDIGAANTTDKERAAALYVEVADLSVRMANGERSPGLLAEMNRVTKELATKGQ